MKLFERFYPTSFFRRTMMLVCIIHCITIHAFCQSPVFLLTDEREYIRYEVFPKEIFIDETNTMSYQQALRQPFNSISGNDSSRIDPDKTYWYQIRVQKRSSGEWILEFPDAHISYITCYRIDSKGQLIDSMQAGLFSSIQGKPLKHKNHLFPLPPLAQNDTLRWIFKIQSIHPSFVQFQWRSLPSYWDYALVEYHFLGFFYGFLWFVVLINVFFYFSSKDGIYLGHTAFVLGCISYSMGEDEVYTHMYTSLSPWAKDFFFSYGYIFWLTGWYIFYESFFKHYQHKPYRFLFGLGWYVLCTMSAFFKYNFHIELSVVWLSWACVESFQKSRKGHPFAHLFFIGFSVVFIGQFAFLARVMGWVHSNVITYYSNYGAYMLYNLVFTLIMGEKLAILKKIKFLAQRKVISQYQQNLELQDKVNRELETKVKERTDELQHKNNELIDSNRKLEIISEQMLKMSEQIDKENWNLKKEIKYTLRTKIEKSVFTYQDFREIYPHPGTCYDLLEEIKWSKGFVCLKCGQSDYERIDDKGTRRCISCGHEEKVKFRTLLQGVKFDLTQALFIVYHVVESPIQMTVDELSAHLNLRRNTCWAFRKKVKEVQTAYPMLRWKDLLIKNYKVVS